MDKKLKEAIDKGISDREKKESASRKMLKDKQDKHKEYINSYLPRARKWINNILFAEIAKVEASTSNYRHRNFYLGSGHTDGIPAEAIYEAAKKIKGLKPTYECPSIYENAEYVGSSEPLYSIGWESTDPNDNRNDR